MYRWGQFKQHILDNWYESWLVAGAWFFYTFTHQPQHVLNANEYITRMWLP